MATEAFAQNAATKDKMLAALEGTAKGKCIDEIMSPMLLDACENQLPRNQQMLSGLGAINGATYRGMQDMGNGLKGEAYKVEFANGSMLWVASLDGEGQLLILWSSGEIRKK